SEIARVVGIAGEEYDRRHLGAAAWNEIEARLQDFLQIEGWNGRRCRALERGRRDRRILPDRDPLLPGVDRGDNEKLVLPPPNGEGSDLRRSVGNARMVELTPRPAAEQVKVAGTVGGQQIEGGVARVDRDYRRESGRRVGVLRPCGGDIERRMLEQFSVHH